MTPRRFLCLACGLVALALWWTGLSSCPPPGTAAASLPALTPTPTVAPQCLSWRAEPTFAVPRAYAAGVVANDGSGDKVYVISGETAPGAYTSSVQRFNPTTGTWAAMPSITIPGTYLRATSIGMRIYVPGGYNANNGGALQMVQVFYSDPGLNYWIICPHPPLEAIAADATASTNSKVYIIGGSLLGGAVTEHVWEHDPFANTYAAKASMPVAESHAGAVALGGSVYVFGGANSYLSYAFDPVANTWTALAPGPTPNFRSPGVFALNGEVWVVGGMDANGNAYPPAQQVQIYNPATDSWRFGPAMLAPRSAPAAGVINGRAYVAGGLDSNGAYLSSMESIAYEPCATTTATATPTSAPSPTAIPHPGTIYTVVNTNDSGPGSLRQAILDANANPGTDTIAFDIPGSGVHTIMPSAALPTVNDPVFIDGYTQPGSSPNTLGMGDNAVLLIELNGTNAGFVVDGLTINAGYSVVRGLVINNFRNNGITLQGMGINTIEGNFIGTDPTGTTAQPNTYHGIYVFDSNANIIGGTTPAARNLLSGNGYSGVMLTGNSTNNLVMGNYVGTNAAGTGSVSNSAGVSMMAGGNIVGGTVPGAGNLISGNRNNGVSMTSFSGGTVQGNFIGTDPTGTTANPNGGSGIWLFNAVASTIGGDTPAARNVIAGNAGHGVYAQDSQSAVVRGNYIGVAAGGAGALGNGGSGVLIQGSWYGSSAHQIGGDQPGQGNTIGHNGQGGVYVTASFTSTPIHNRITGNSIYENTGLGIALGSQVPLPNDSCDGDPGINHSQNYPVLSAAASMDGYTTISGVLDSAPNSHFRLEFFSSTAPDPSGYGEGATYLGSLDLDTGSNCVAPFYALLAVPVPSGRYVTSTATELGGDTSEFSAYVVSTLGIAPTVTPAPTYTPTATPTRTVTSTPTRSVTVTAIATTGTPTITATATPVCPIQFSDVQPGSTFYNYINCLSCRGIVQGYSDNTFRPNNPVTRGQLAKIVSNAAGFTEPASGQTFEDVPPGSTFYDYVERMASRSIISGYGCGGVGEPCIAPGNRPYFRPGANITRRQTAKIVAIAAGLPAPPSGQQTFEDVPEGSTFWQWIESLAATGAISGYECGGVGEPCLPPQDRPYFRPSNNVTRGQSAKIVTGAFFPGCTGPSRR